MAAGLGVRFGSSSSCVAVNKDGKTDVIANDLGDRVTPCFIAFTEHDQAIGVAAKQGLIRNPQNTVFHVKQIFGKKFNDPDTQKFIQNSTAVVLNKDELTFEVEYKTKMVTFTVSKIVELFYHKLLEIGQSRAGNGSSDAVLTVPMSFSKKQCIALSQIATEAGFTVLRVITEPVAAVLAYDIAQGDNPGSRLGGVSCDVTVIRVCAGMYTVVSNVTDYQLGGDNFTEVLFQHLTFEFQRQFKYDVRENKRTSAKLRIASETCKHALSSMSNTQCAVDSLYDGIDFHTNISRARFESLCSNLRSQCLLRIETALEKADLDKSAIHKVILSGGGSKVPLVQKMISDSFPHADILNSIAPDEVIALGAAKEAGILIGYKEKLVTGEQQQTQVECLSHAIAVKVPSGELLSVFPQYTPIPSKCQIELLSQPDQTSFFMDILELRDQKCGDELSEYLHARVVIKDLPESAKIAAAFHLNSESLQVTCVEQSSNTEESIAISFR